MLGLVDCNNFYASCERVFRPDLEGKPVAVLSNNDGCIIARSQEVKDMGIPMGAPMFQHKATIEGRGVTLFSPNFTFYGDMSGRVMQIIQAAVPTVEVYSIDEAFIDISLWPDYEQIDYCRELQARVKQWTGIPVSIGLAPTKTLAKLANRIAKKHKRCRGVYSLSDRSRYRSTLSQIDVTDVWGIGSRLGARLNKYGVHTAWDLASAEINQMRKEGGVVLERTVRELRGEPCIPFELEAEPKQQIMVSRSFGHDVLDFEQLRAAVVSFAVRAAEKLRKQKSCTQCVHVFAYTNQFREQLPQYKGEAKVNLDHPTQATATLINAVVQGLQAFYKPGFHYKKAGIMLDKVLPESVAQLCLFSESEQDQGLSKVMDAINDKMGAGVVRLAAMDVGEEWRMHQQMRSPRYTTRWSELPVVN